MISALPDHQRSSGRVARALQAAAAEDDSARLRQTQRSALLPLPLPVLVLYYRYLGTSTTTTAVHLLHQVQLNFNC
jgi:hypothetical protein